MYCMMFVMCTLCDVSPTPLPVCFPQATNPGSELHYICGKCWHVMATADAEDACCPSCKVERRPNEQQVLLFDVKRQVHFASFSWFLVLSLSSCLTLPLYV